MKQYEIHRPFLMQLAKNDVPFVTFDQFNNLVKLYRDEFYATQHVDGFINDIGVAYNVWTVECTNHYRRHLWLDRITQPIWITFDVPELQRHATIPLHIKIFDDDGVYFEQRQRISLERRIEDRFFLCSWRKIEPVRQFVEREVSQELPLDCG